MRPCNLRVIWATRSYHLAADRWCLHFRNIIAISDTYHTGERHGGHMMVHIAPQVGFTVQGRAMVTVQGKAMVLALCGRCETALIHIGCLVLSLL